MLDCCRAVRTAGVSQIAAMLLAGALAAGFVCPVRGQTLAANSPFADANLEQLVSQLRHNETLDKLVTAIALDNMPHQFVDESDWDQTSSVFAGVKVSREGLRLKTKRRRKEVNHGTWKRYQVDLVDPRENFQIEFRNIRPNPDGGIECEVICDARLRAHARLARWQTGVQLFSFGIEADARIRLTAGCEIRTRLDPARLPPDLVVVPHVVRTELELVEFEVNRISRVGGDVAEELGRGLRRVMDSRLTAAQDKLTTKLNRTIAAHEGELRFSVYDAFSRKNP